MSSIITALEKIKPQSTHQIQFTMEIVSLDNRQMQSAHKQ